MKNFIQKSFLCVVLFGVMAFMVLPFSSCSSTPTNTNTNASTVGTASDDESTTRRRSSDDDDEPENCDHDEGDPCKDSEDCMEDCAFIYKGHSQARTSCQNRGDETVAKLVTVHNRLMGSHAGVNKANATRSGSDVRDDLEDITDEKDDVGLDEFKCYLQIGAGKYISQIREKLAPSANSSDGDNGKARLIETLKWLVVHNHRAAEVLNEDLNRGDEILEELLLKLVLTRADGKDSDCLSGHTGTQYSADRWNAGARSGKGGALKTGAWRIEGDREIKIRFYKNSSAQEGTIQLKSSKDGDLFTALSCFHSETAERNIFSYSAKEDNEHAFNLALSLLTSICREVTDKSKKQAGCARAMMCWTSWQNSCSGSGDRAKGGGCMYHEKTNTKNEKLWKMLSENYEDDLENENGSEYNNCTAEGFADFF